MLKQQTLKTIQKYDMMSSGDRVLVGISGGADSTALLLVLKALSKDLRIKLFSASLDHMFRKNESRADVEFVRRLSKKLKIPFYTEKIDVPKLVQAKGGSKEDLARQVRYKFFIRAAKKFKANKIALAHTVDDQAETVLMRLIYGAGTTGLAGIPPTRKINTYLITRPFIETARKNIDLYLKQNKIKPCIDATNDKEEFKRNKIRKQLLRLLEKEYNPNIKETLARTAALLRDDRDLLDEVLLKKVFSDVIRINKNNIVSLSLKKYDKLHIALKKYVLRECIRIVNSHLTGIEYRHWRLLEDFIAKRKNKATWHLPRGCRARIKKDNILFFNEL